MNGRSRQLMPPCSAPVSVSAQSSLMTLNGSLTALWQAIALTLFSDSLTLFSDSRQVMALESVARTESRPVSRYGQRQEIPSTRGKVHYNYLFTRGMYDFGYDTGAYNLPRGVHTVRYTCIRSMSGQSKSPPPPRPLTVDHVRGERRFQRKTHEG